MTTSGKRTATLLAGGLLFGAVPAMAADHGDSPAVKAEGGDPAADINDVYTFTSPSDPKKLVAIVTIGGNPGITEFSDAVSYVINFTQYPPATPAVTFSAVCDFPAPDNFACQLLSGDGNGVAGASGERGEVESVDGTFKAFAGPASDPFFFDLDGFVAVTTGAGGFNGTDDFAANNVLAIVLEFDSALVTTGAADGSKQLAVSATTFRKPAVE